MGARFDDVDQLAVNTLRTLAMDAIEKANSGHPGAPLGLAPVAWTLFSRVLEHDPEDPSWVDRDRFVLSAGHASMLLYGVLHLTGYDVTLEDIKAFRQWQSRTPGHPEVGHVPGVEITTGPLGQGCATSVGLALAEAHLGEVFNGPGVPIVDHRTWVVCGDGDLMEGVSAEAASLAGHLGLSKLCWIWDDNRITIDGATDLTISDDIEGRFRTYGWHVVRVEDANDLDALAAAFDAAAHETERPTLVAVRSHIGFSAPTKQDTAGAHGAPLGPQEIRGAKKNLGWPEDAEFFVPDVVAERGQDIARRGAETHAAWQERYGWWAEAHPEQAEAFSRRLDGRLPEGWTDALPVVEFGAKGPATRAASGTVINALAEVLPEMVGGSADLGPSCKTTINASRAITNGSWGGRNLHYGIREHAMGAVMGGLALHGGIRPFGSTFLVFADYMRPAIRLAALMGLPVIYVFTHDSIWVGEDGPTHQPVEHVASLRVIPDVVVLRPADANETAAAWRVALERREGPTALILSRQGLPILDGTAERAQEGVKRGAWCPVPDSGSPQVVLLATGSEVQLAVEAGTRLGERGIMARVVSMPSHELFDAQDEEYRRALLPPGVPAVAIEAGVTFGWERYTGTDGAVIGIDRFGASAPGAVVAEKLGFTVERIVEAAFEVIKS
ncbi:MAG: transketolase [Acidobacteriota bacterium]